MTMTPDEYVKNAVRTKSDRLYVPDSSSGTSHLRGGTGLTADVTHAIVGISTEGGELLDVVKKAMFYGKPVDYVNLDEEIGDVLWYIAIYCAARGVGIEALMAQNIAKLQKRFPAAFTEEAANNRNLAAERETLEQHSADMQKS